MIIKETTKIVRSITERDADAFMEGASFAIVEFLKESGVTDISADEVCADARQMFLNYCEIEGITEVEGEDEEECDEPCECSDDCSCSCHEDAPEDAEMARFLSTLVTALSNKIKIE